jgi:hypothetical protein
LRERFGRGVSEHRQHHFKAGIGDRKRIRTVRVGNTEQKSSDGLPLRPAPSFLGEPENDFARVGQSVDCSAILKMDRQRRSRVNALVAHLTENC